MEIIVGYCIVLPICFILASILMWIKRGVDRLFMQGAPYGKRYYIVSNSQLPSDEQFGTWSVTKPGQSKPDHMVTAPWGAVFSAGDTIERVDIGGEN